MLQNMSKPLWHHQSIAELIVQWDCSKRGIKIVDTHLLAWEQQELDCNRMVGYLMTKQLDASVEINSVTQQSKHRYHAAWPND